MGRFLTTLLAAFTGLAGLGVGGLDAKNPMGPGPMAARPVANRGWLTLSLHGSGGVPQGLAGVWRDSAVVPMDGRGPLTLSPDLLGARVLPDAPLAGVDGDDGLPAPTPAVEKVEKAPLLKMELPADGSWITNVVDYESVDQQGFTADMVRFVLPVGKRFQPLVAFGHQYTDLNDNGRFGVGTGARWLLGPGADFGTQLMVFPADAAGNDLDGMNRHEVRAMARFSINF